MKLHAGERLSKITYCEKRFSVKSNSRGMKLHAGEKLSKITRCEKRFSVKSNCQRHEVTCRGKTFSKSLIVRRGFQLNAGVKGLERSSKMLK